MDEHPALEKEDIKAALLYASLRLKNTTVIHPIIVVRTKKANSISTKAFQFGFMGVKFKIDDSALKLRTKTRFKLHFKFLIS